MPSLIEIKNKIKSTKGTQKITKAMQLVAAAKMKTFQKTALSVREYTKLLGGELELCGSSIDEIAFAEPREKGKVLFILMTSDKGLCGAMNARLMKTLYRSEKWNGLSADERELITVGRKATDTARAMGIPTVASFVGLKEDMKTVDALEVIHVIMERWASEEVKEVVLVAPIYVNPFIFETKLKTYLPLTRKRVEEEVESDINVEPQEASFFEPSKEEAIDRIAQLLVESLFIESFYELKATEYSSRMVAMKQATEAAGDRIKLLTNVFNRARQSAITQQLSELAAANEAMSSENQYETFEV